MVFSPDSLDIPSGLIFVLYSAHMSPYFSTSFKFFIASVFAPLIVLGAPPTIANPPAKKAYAIKVKLKGLKDTTCFLAYHMGDKQYLADTAKVDKNGNMEFEGKEKLQGGIYMVVLPNRKYFEIIVSEQFFAIESDTADLVGKMKVTGTKENQLFLDYLGFVQKKGKVIEELGKRLRAQKANKDSADILRKKLATEEESLNTYRKGISEANPTTFMATLMNALSEPKRSEPPKASNGRPDSVYKFYDQRTHYFDNINFKDERILRTPILLAKVKYYTEQMYPQEPDSLNRACDVVLTKAKANKDVFRYLLYTLSNFYETSKFMGMDGVFAHVAGTYYLGKDVDWLDSATKAKIKDRVGIITPLLIGKPAPKMVLQDTNGKSVPLYSVKADFMAVIFYDPNCGHCQKELPRLNGLYRDTLKAKGMEVYAACAERDPKAWKAFVKKHNLSFINGFDKDTVVDFRKYWDVYSYPVLYVLDADKKIVAKRLAVEDLNGLVDMMAKDRDRKKKQETKPKG